MVGRKPKGKGISRDFKFPLVLLQAKVVGAREEVLGIMRATVSISSPSSEGGGKCGGLKYATLITVWFPLVLLQAKVVGCSLGDQCPLLQGVSISSPSSEGGGS